jgi:hypothetical protein
MQATGFLGATVEITITSTRYEDKLMQCLTFARTCDYCWKWPLLWFNNAHQGPKQHSV